MQGLYGGRGPHAFPLAGLFESDGEYTGDMGYHRTHGSGIGDLQPLGSDAIWCSVMRQKEQNRTEISVHSPRTRMPEHHEKSDGRVQSADESRNDAKESWSTGRDPSSQVVTTESIDRLASTLAYVCALTH